MIFTKQRVYLFLSTIIFLWVGMMVTLPGIAESKNPTTKRFKILHIMSYHSPWEWTDTMLAGFKDSLNDVNVEYRVYQMDTKRNSSEEWKERVGKEARYLIDSWKPDLVYTTDDDACKYVTKYYVNSNLPIVCAAVNEDPKVYGFAGSKNVTGVLEIEHFVESVKLLKQVDPSVKNIAVVLDDAPMWEPVVARMRDKLGELPQVRFVRWDTILTWAEFKQKMLEYQKTVDAIALIGIFNYKDENGKNVRYQDVLKWTAQYSKLPDFSFWTDRASFGTLCVVSVSGYQQGLAAGKMARAILVDGKSPASIKMTATTKGEPIISLARANALGIKIRSKILLTAQVYKEYIWDKK